MAKVNKVLAGLIGFLVGFSVFSGVLFYNQWRDSITFKESLEKQGIEIKKIRLNSLYIIASKEEFLDLANKTNIVYKQGVLYYVFFEGLWYCYEIPMRWP